MFSTVKPTGRIMQKLIMQMRNILSSIPLQTCELSCVCCFFLTFMMGCGGGGSTPQAGGGGAPAPAPAPTNVAPPPTNVQVTTPTTKKQTPKVQLKQATGPTDVAPDIYNILSTPLKNYRVKFWSNELNLYNQFRVIRHAQNTTTGTQFTIIQRPPPKVVYPRKGDLALPEGLVEQPEYGYAEDGMPLRVLSKNDIPMVYIPPGVSIIGVENGPPDAPLLSAFSDSFYIDLYETTLAEYQSYREEQKKDNKRIPTAPSNSDQPENFPALGIHWGQARAYLKYLGKDFPSEIEWEIAARGRKGYTYSWGNDRAVWKRARGLNEISAVDEFPGDISPYLVRGMAGNAKEWCLDFYDPKSYTKATRFSQTAKNWKGPNFSSPRNHRVVRGNGQHWQIYHRDHRVMSSGYDDVGFRGVVRITPEPEPEPEEKETNVNKN